MPAEAQYGVCYNPRCRKAQDFERRGKLFCSPACEDTARPIVEDARAGLRRTCVDCGRPPYGGGMRCVPCFTRVATGRPASNQAKPSRPAAASHECLRHEPGYTCYSLCKCRCVECRAGSAAYQRRRRANLGGKA
jgi:hypothetical protein